MTLCRRQQQKQLASLRLRNCEQRQERQRKRQIASEKLNGRVQRLTRAKAASVTSVPSSNNNGGSGALPAENPGAAETLAPRMIYYNEPCLLGMGKTIRYCIFCICSEI